MLDRPDAAELLEALAAFLDHDVVPTFEGSRRFHALVAANVARIVARELRMSDELIVAELEDLRTVLGPRPLGELGAPKERLYELSTELCSNIEKGLMDDDPARSRVLAYVKRSIARRLEVDNPKFPR